VTEELLPVVDFGGAATYRILVQGHVGDEWSARVSGLRLSTATAEDGSSRTELFGRLSDQAALQGVLATLYGLHVSILVVQALDAEKKGEPE